VWYLAEILFAEPSQPDRTEYQCESCDVVLRATDATEAYQKAVTWGLAHASEPPSAMRLLGVSHLTTIGDELGDGTEISGRFFEVRTVWDRVGELIPPSTELGAIRWEAGRDTPLGESLGPEQVAQLKRAWGQGD
jgi:hypothetical protein